MDVSAIGELLVFVTSTSSSRGHNNMDDAMKRMFGVWLVLLALSGCAGDPFGGPVMFSSGPPVTTGKVELASAAPPPPPETAGSSTTTAVIPTTSELPVRATGHAAKPVAAGLVPRPKPSQIVPDVPPVMPAANVAAAPAPKTGSAAYYIPKQMVESRASQVDLWIDRAGAIAMLKQELAQRLQIDADKIKVQNIRHVSGQSGSPVVAEIDGASIAVGDNMIAQLRGGEDFNIDPKEPVTQSLKGEERAKWNWRVMPKRESDSGLQLSLDIWIDPGSGKHLIDSYHELVVVKARSRTLYEIAQDFNQWLALFGVGGIGGLCGWLWTRYRRQG